MTTVRFDDCVCTQATRKAILVDIPDHGETWIPQAPVHDDSEVYQLGDEGTLIIDEAFARRKGLE